MGGLDTHIIKIQPSLWQFIISKLPLHLSYYDKRDDRGFRIGLFIVGAKPWYRRLNNPILAEITDCVYVHKSIDDQIQNLVRQYDDLYKSDTAIVVTVDVE